MTTGNDLQALTWAEEALSHAEQECRYHGGDFGFLGWERQPFVSPPRCDSCKQPWRVTRAREYIATASRIRRREMSGG
jgi:hypothetical protein